MVRAKMAARRRPRRDMTRQRLRVLLVALWLLGVGSALFVYLFHRDAIEHQLRSAVSISVIAGGLVYLVLGCLRGFTLVPSTSLVIAAVAFFPPVPRSS